MWRHRYLLISMLLSGCAPSTLGLARHAGAIRRVTAYESDGVVTLGVKKVGKSGGVATAEGSDALERLWASFDLPGTAPVVNFSTKVVIAWVHDDDSCLDELTALRIDADGTLRAEFAPSLRPCVDSFTHTVHVAAVPRRLARQAVRFAGEVLRFGPAVANPPASSAPPPPSARRGPLRHEICSVPERGHASACRLDDGTPVFIVHHDDGAVHALAADDQDPTTNNRGIVSWSPSGRFVGLERDYDEYGADVFSANRALDRYVTKAATSGTVVVGARVSMPRGANWGPIRPRRAPAARESDIPAFPPNERISIEDARTNHQNKVVVLDASVVSRDRSASQICKIPRDMKAFHGCDGNAVDVQVVDGPWDLVRTGWLDAHLGPFAGRVQGTDLNDLIDLTGYRSTFLNGSVDSYAGMLAAEERTVVRAEWLTAAAATFGQGAGYAGADTRFSVSWWFGNARGRRELPDFLLGDTLGIGGRFRFGTGSNQGQGASILHFGLTPLLANRMGLVRVPSLLGAAIPEVGIRIRSFGPPRGYLGFYLPVTLFDDHMDLRNFEFGLSAFYLPVDRAVDFGVHAGLSFR